MKKINNIKIEIAEKAGFCFGVQRALDLTEKTVKNEVSVYCWGDLVHNPEVMNGLKEKGLRVVYNLKDFPEKAVFVVRSHGMNLEDLNFVEKKAIKVINTTCPFVIKAQKCAKKMKEEDFKVLLFGDKDHVEVKGINSRTANSSLIVKDVKELKENKAKLKGKIGIVCQTTQKNSKLKEITDYLKKEGIDFQLNNTICLNTTKKQKEVANLNSDINVLVVIGGLHSSNTTKLAEIGRVKKIRTYHIEKAEDISKNWFKDEIKVFITAGASTPYEETEKAKKIIENFNFGINKKSVII